LLLLLHAAHALAVCNMDNNCFSCSLINWRGEWKEAKRKKKIPSYAASMLRQQLRLRIKMRMRMRRRLLRMSLAVSPKVDWDQGGNKVVSCLLFVCCRQWPTSHELSTLWAAQVGDWFFFSSLWLLPRSSLQTVVVVVVFVCGAMRLTCTLCKDWLKSNIAIDVEKKSRGLSKRHPIQDTRLQLNFCTFTTSLYHCYYIFIVRAFNVIRN